MIGTDEATLLANAPAGAVTIDLELLGGKREDLPEYQQFHCLKGKPTWAAKAGRDYGIPGRTISRWATAGLIRVIGQDKNRLLLDSQDVAFVAYMHHQHGTKGRATFTDNGLPNIKE